MLRCQNKTGRFHPQAELATLNSPGEDEDDEDTDGGCEDDLSLGVQSPVTMSITLALGGIRELVSLLANERPV